MHTTIEVGPRPPDLRGEKWSEKVSVLFCKECHFIQDGCGAAYAKGKCPVCGYQLVFLDGFMWEIELYRRELAGEKFSTSSSTVPFNTQSTMETLTPEDIRSCMEEVDLLLANAGHMGPIDLTGAMLAVNPGTGLQKTANGMFGPTVKAYDFIPEDEVILVDPFYLDRKNMSPEEVERHIRECSCLMTNIGDGHYE